MNGKRSVEQELLKLLRHGGLNKENLAALVKIVAGFSDSGLKNLKVFPRGIPPIYESLEVRSVVESKQIGKMLEIILAETQVGQIRLFPYGVPVIDLAELVITLGPTPSQSASAATQAASD